MSATRFGTGASSTSSEAGASTASTSRSPFSVRSLARTWRAIAEVMRREAAATEPFVLAPVGYRETRSVGMLVLDDPSGHAASLADRVQRGLEHLGVYEREHRAWLPHITCLRFRARPGLDPPLPAIEPFAPSGVAALLSRLHPSGARYEVLESCSVHGRRGG